MALGFTGPALARPGALGRVTDELYVVPLEAASCLPTIYKPGHI